jgi:hypothetical protein
MVYFSDYARQYTQYIKHYAMWNKNFSHSAYEKSEAKMAAIDVQ